MLNVAQRDQMNDFTAASKSISGITWLLAALDKPIKWAGIIFITPLPRTFINNACLGCIEWNNHTSGVL